MWNNTDMDIISHITNVLDMHFYSFESKIIADDGVYCKYKIEGNIDEGEISNNGDPMPWGVFISLVVTFKRKEAHYFFCEFSDNKTGVIMNYIYEKDYHIFDEDFKRVVKANGLPF